MWTVSAQFQLLLEDADTLALEHGNWWHARVKLVEKWLWEEANRAGIPDDGSEEVCCRQHPGLRLRFIVHERAADLVVLQSLTFSSR